VFPDDDKRYDIETCRSSESVLQKWFKNKWHTISTFVGCVIISETMILTQASKLRNKKFPSTLPKVWNIFLVHTINYKIQQTKNPSQIINYFLRLRTQTVHFLFPYLFASQHSVVTQRAYTEGRAGTACEVPGP